MPPVVVDADAGCLRVAGQPLPTVFGEMHYWRLNPARWRACLESMRRLGVRGVSTYVPWEDHERAPGRFDLSGESNAARNLVGFLELCQELGLWVFVRPGPYIYAEWTNAGVPDRVVTLPRLSEAYRAEARVWMEAVTSALRPFFARGPGATDGPIVLLQPDNEIDLFSHWFESWCGLDGPRGEDNPRRASGESFFHEFLREVYGDVASLNEAWSTRYAAIEEARAQASRLDPHDAAMCRRARDFWRFQHWATRRIVRWHAETYRELGVTVPMVANYYPGGDVQNWRELSPRNPHGGAGVDLLAIDWYPRAHFRGPPQPEAKEGQASGGGGIFGLPAHRERRIFHDTLRLQRLVSPVAMIGEFECGVWHGYHEYTGILTPQHYREMYAEARRAGVQAINWYMFVGRDNWYFTPINERGDIRPELGEVFIELHTTPPGDGMGGADEGSGPGVTAYLDLDQIATDNILADNPVLQALYDSGLSVAMWDPDLWRGPRPGVIVYASSWWQPRTRMEALADAAAAGTTLIFVRQWPRYDERFERCDVLERRLGLTEPARVLSHLGKRVEVDAGAVASWVRERIGAGRGGVVVLPHANVAAAVARLVAGGATSRQTARELVAFEPDGGAAGGLAVWEPAELPPGAEPIFGEQVAGKQQAIENADKWMTGYVGRRWCVGALLPGG